MAALDHKQGSEEQGFSLRQNECFLALNILEESILKLMFFRARHQDIQGRFDLRFLRDRACETYRPPFKPITKKEVDLWDWKLAWDLSLLQKVLSISRGEITAAGRCSTLVEFVQRKRELLLEDKNFRQLEKQPPSKKAQRTYDKEKEQEDKVEELKKEQKRLEDLYERTVYRSKSIKQYYQHYQNSRKEQNKYKVKLAEKVLNDKILSIIKEEDNENTAHRLTTKFLQAALQRLDEKLAYWTVEKKNDIAWRNLEIKKLDDEHKNITKVMKELVISFGEREREILQYQVEREERRKQEETEEHRRRCAIKIQAWWRGCMVRCNLGPFCPDHLKKKKKKCKKK